MVPPTLLSAPKAVASASHGETPTDATTAPAPCSRRRLLSALSNVDSDIASS